MQHYAYNKNKFLSKQILNDDKKNYDESIQINHNPNWPYLTGHPNRILIISSSGSGKTNCY